MEHHMPTTLSAQPDDQPDFFATGPSGFLRVNIKTDPIPEQIAKKQVAGYLNRFNGHPDACATDEDVARMVNYLLIHGWQTARTIAQALNLGEGEAGKRKCRAIANQSQGHIISGQFGYAATCAATKEDIRHACAWLRSQAREMEARAREIEAVRPPLATNHKD